jgi:hypothetical protein
MSELARELELGGGADAPGELSARLRGLLAAELAHGVEELAKPRSGYGGRPVVVALAAAERAALAVCPAAPELRADPAAVTERTAFVVAAAVEALVEGAGPGPVTDASELWLRLGADGDWLALRYPAQDGREAAELAMLALEERLTGVDRLRAQPLLVPEHVVESAGDWREPIGPTHPLRVAEAARRMGASTLDDDSLEGCQEALERLLEPGGSTARAHDDPDPVRRVARRMLQRLDGMGKWGGYHTEFVHLGRGFGKGNERSLALEVGERLLAAGLLGEKISVGQRHVFLNPSRSGQIRALIDEGEMPPGLSLPAP